MRVCLICEGSYPYVSGGVSSWVQMLCTAFTDVEFVIWSIATTHEEMHEYKYELPSNVKGVYTTYLGESSIGVRHKHVRLSKDDAQTLKELVTVTAGEVDWTKVLDFIGRNRRHLTDILMEKDFFRICCEEYERQQSVEGFTDYLWTLRSMYLPLMDVLSSDIVEADIYHSLSTGYAGILAGAVSYIRNKPMILSEHGIYTREREEDIIRANWVKGDFKELWIDFFKKISTVAYQQADVVTTLFGINRELQIELGCPEEKIVTIPNGVDSESFKNLPSLGKIPQDKFNFGTILRIVPIKDVKTMILAFQIVREKEENVRLTIMGNYDENPEYYEECVRLIKEFNVPDVVFTGQVNVREYVPDVDVLVLSSISEGQPFAILEGLAAGIPFVATNVGSCKELLEGFEGDDFGKAGIVVPLMDSAAMADAFLYMLHHPEEVQAMGEAGRARVEKYYQKEAFLKQYHDLYDELGGK